MIFPKNDSRQYVSNSVNLQVYYNNHVNLQ